MLVETMLIFKGPQKKWMTRMGHGQKALGHVPQSMRERNFSTVMLEWLKASGKNP